MPLSLQPLRARVHRRAWHHMPALPRLLEGATLNLPLIPQDKANHAIYGACIALVVQQLATPDIALLSAVACGVLKEAIDAALNWRARRTRREDLLPPHGVEPLDAVATAAGGLAIYLAGLSHVC